MKFLKTDLEKVSWIRHGFFTRQGGASTGLYTSLNCGLRGDDKAQNVTVNRARVAQALGFLPENLVTAKQVHGVKVLRVEKPEEQEDAPAADALVTNVPGIALGVLTADCAPVLLVDKNKKIIGAAHAGWRGALAGVLEETVAAMQALGSRPDNIEVAIGPCIAFNSYEVKDDFPPVFIEQDKGNKRFFKKSPKPGHQLFDLPGYCAARLKGAGVARVHDVHQDTLTSGNLFFSNRRAFLKSEKSFGLQISVIGIV